MKIFLKILTIVILSNPMFLLAQMENPTIPDSPANLLARTGGRDIYVQWDVPASDGGSALDGYNLNYRQGNSGDWMSIFTSQTSYVLLDLNLDTEYQIFVTAVNVVGESQPSEIINVQMGPSGGGDNTPPGVVGEIVVSNISNNEATVSWATDELATSSIFYDVHRENQHGLVTVVTTTLDHQINLTGLVSCTTYFFVVGGEDESGNSYTSTVENFETSGCIGNVTSDDVGELVAPDSVNNFSFENAKVEIVAAPGTTSRDAVFQVKRLNVSSVDSEVGCPVDAKPLGENIYDIKLLDNYDSVASVQEPVTVTLNYGDEDLQNIKEESLSLYHYTEGVGWQKLQACIVNKTAKTISCEVASFSKFMIAVDENCDETKSFWRKTIDGFGNILNRVDSAIKKFFWRSDLYNL